MTKIARRRAVVSLYQGNYESELAELADRALAALRAEESNATRRHGTKSEASRLAVEHDQLLVEAEESTVKVTLWAMTWQQWDELEDKHPARTDNDDDDAAGFNTKTIGNDVLLAALVDPEGSPKPDTLDEMLAIGKVRLTELGDLSRTHHAKLKQAAWVVNAGDDTLPKGSLVSALARIRETDSKRLQDSP